MQPFLRKRTLLGRVELGALHGQTIAVQPPELVSYRFLYKGAPTGESAFSNKKVDVANEFLVNGNRNLGLAHKYDNMSYLWGCQAARRTRTGRGGRFMEQTPFDQSSRGVILFLSDLY